MQEEGKMYLCYCSMLGEGGVKMKGSNPTNEVGGLKLLLN